MVRKHISFAFAAALAPCPAVEAELEVGRKAPKLVAEFVKGTAQDPTAADGNVYVVEYWAPWCAPCRASIPHLAELASRLGPRGVRVIGVTNEDKETVQGFELLEQMTYHVALATDSYDVWTEKLEGIPHAFVVDQTGTVAWSDHPMNPKLERVLGLVLDRKYDIAKEKARADRIAALEAELEEAWSEEEPDVERVLRCLDALIELEPVNSDRYMAKISFANDFDRPDIAHAARVAAGEAFKDNAQALNGLSWDALTNNGIDADAIAIGLKMAQRAAELVAAMQDPSLEMKASIFDTLARAWYCVGRLDLAIEWQQKSVDVGCEPLTQDLQRSLTHYQKLAILGKQGSAKGS